MNFNSFTRGIEELVKRDRSVNFKGDRTISRIISYIGSSRRFGIEGIAIKSYSTI